MVEYLCSVDLFQRVEILEDDFNLKLRPAHGYDLHGLAMMRGARVACLHSSTEEVFYTTKNEGGVVNGVDLGPQKGAGKLSDVSVTGGPCFIDSILVYLSRQTLRKHYS